MKFLNKIITIFLISTPLMLFQPVNGMKSETDINNGKHSTIKMKTKFHSTGEIEYRPLQNRKYIRIVRSHAQVRNELIKSAVKNISNAFCNLFSS